MTRIVAFCVGMVAVLWLPELPPRFILWSALPVLLVLLRVRRLRWFAAGLLGCWVGCWSGYRSLDAQLPQALEGQDIPLTLCVADIPDTQRAARGPVTRFSARVLTAANAPRWQQQRLLLSWYAPVALSPGDQLRVTVRLKRPRGLVNPGGFDYQAWLLSQGISATGYVRSSQREPQASRACDAPVMALRAQVLDELRQRFAGERMLPVLEAVVLGVRTRMSVDQWSLFAQTGTTHLMVISGLHISLVGMLTLLIVSAVARRSYWLMHRATALQVGMLVSMGPVVGYALLAGFGIPVRRAVLMLAVAVVMTLWQRRVSVWAGFVYAILIVLLFDPMAPLQAGFWLSFGAVAGLIGGVHRARYPSRGRLFLRTQWVASVALILPLAIYGLPQSVLAPLVNLFAIPLMSVWVIPLGLLGTASLAIPMMSDLLIRGALVGLECLQWGLQTATDGFSHTVQLGQPSIVGAALAMLGTVVLLAPSGFPARWIGGVLLMPLILGAESRPVTGAAEIWVFDVGQGTSVAVLTARYALVFDAGPRFSERFDAGRDIVAPALKRRGIHHLDRFVISHSDNDHAGGAQGLLGVIPATEVIAGEPEAGQLACQSGQQWVWDQVSFRIIHPGKQVYQRDNNRSCVLQIRIGPTRVLLTGDIESRVERELIARVGRALQSDVLLVPHHGSKTSSSAAFIAAVAPEQAIVTSGWRNRFGHPAEGVVQRFRMAGIAIENTAVTGAIRLDIDETGAIKPITRFREQQRRYWFDE